MVTVTTNTSANTAIRYLNINSSQAANSLAKISSGSRIVKASDDAASLAVGSKLKADVSALKQASVNAANASSLLQVADGGMATASDILIRMKAIATQANNDSLSTTEQGYLDKEFQKLNTQLGNIASQTKFNGVALLGGSFTSKTFQVSSGSSDTISIAIGSVTSVSGSVTSTSLAASAASAIDTQLTSLLANRADLGGQMSQLEFAKSTADVSAENLESARSSLMDVDVSSEMANYTSKNVLAQAATSMLAQANQVPQQLLKLLG
ncbi:flagellin [Arboricoccus pini]|uniref:Flagellin n=1 Tax=Arboricoccus pini TaxID=1963835 RepID=A0A212S254_9PROT|nr:flagellin [Arboricoccus pini]SNB79050.1 flagellin [Arboricoccus pini]